MRRLVVLGVLLSVVKVSAGEAEKPGPWTSLQETASPAGPGSGQPGLSAGPGGVVMSWLEPLQGGGSRLRFSVHGDKGWSEPATAAEGALFVANWADVPAVVQRADGSLVAQWLEFTNREKFAYDIRVATSADGGKTWSAPVTPHRDGTQAEHGFVSLFDAPQGGLGIVWLDGRAYAAEAAGGHDGHGSGATALMATTLGTDGQLGPETQLEARVCDCCPTAQARTDSGIVVAYRGRSQEDIRDIRVVRLEAGTWSPPADVHADGWKIDGCPVNGPALAAAGRSVAAAWTTGAGDSPRLLAAFSQDAGASFGTPVRADDGNPIGRVDLELLADGSALLVWVERTEGGAEVRARRIAPDGKLGPSAAVAPVDAGRVSGYPRVARAGNRLVFAWTSTGQTQQVKTALASL